MKEYRSESIEGNLHDVALYMNNVAVKDGWSLVAVQRTGAYCVIIMVKELK